MLRRIFLFVFTNIVIILIGTIMIAVIERVFGISITGRLHASYMSLAIFALIYGFITAFVSLLISRWMAKKSHSIRLITAENLISEDPKVRLVYQVVERIAQAHNIRMPEVGIYPSTEVNAFATGATKNKSLVAASQGLLDTMNTDEIEGVIGHEMAHILNGDMVTMTLLQGIINAFVIFLSRAIAQMFALMGRSDEEGPSHLVYFLSTIILEILFGIGGSLIVMKYSRRREYAADAGSADFVGKNKMIRALEALQRIHPDNTAHTIDDKMNTMKIDGKSTGFMMLFASHPPLSERIERLRNTV